MALSTEQLRAQLQRRLDAEQAKQDKSKRTTALLKAQARDLARQEQLAREAQVGKLAHAAGLLAWDDGTLAHLFGLLGTLRDVQNPVAVLEALLSDVTVTGGMTHVR